MARSLSAGFGRSAFDESNGTTGGSPKSQHPTDPYNPPGISGAGDRQSRSRAGAVPGVTKMAKLKITELSEDKRVKVAVELPASVPRDLVAYAEILAAQSGQSISEPNKLIPLMLARFMATDRAFVRSRKLRKEANG
jgi:hypothetical protein